MRELSLVEAAIVEALQEDHSGAPVQADEEIFFCMRGDVSVSRMAAIIRKRMSDSLRGLEPKEAR